MLCFRCTNYFLCICLISNVVIKDMTILAPLNAPNTDGIDPGMLGHLFAIFVLCIALSFLSTSPIREKKESRTYLS